ncbi:MAG: CerR family C-terminal domain-containing protein [Verrucomicrobiota bacterium]|nr:CerR family C-terminal domain-containing protein [Verrucomicrobiota bacterium]
MSLTNAKISTEEGLLIAACKLFSDKGYKDTTIAEISRTSEANVAAVNYYFRDKATLYRKSAKRAFQITEKAFPLDIISVKEKSAEEKLKYFIETALSRVFATGEEGYFSKIMLKELSEPTETLDWIVEKIIIPKAKWLNLILREIVGEDVSERTVSFCHMAIINQCMFFSVNKEIRKRLNIYPELNNQDVKELAETIYCFSINGLKGVMKYKHEHRKL